MTCTVGNNKLKVCDSWGWESHLVFVVASLCPAEGALYPKDVSSLCFNSPDFKWGCYLLLPQRKLSQGGWNLEASRCIAES